MSRARDIADLLDSAGKVTADDLDVGAIGGRRNLIINGGFDVWQRGTSFTSSGYTADRWRFAPTTTATIAVEKADSGLPEHRSSLKLTTTSGVSTQIADRTYFDYVVEDSDICHVGYGTSDAKQMTLSFWVRSSVVGQYAVFLYQPDASPTRMCNIPYTIDSANTWEKKTVIVPADTAGNINSNNNHGLYVRFFVSAGSNWTGGSADSLWKPAAGNEAPEHTAQVTEVTGATWELTGVQLELGSVATPFEHRSYGEELALCQRYYYKATFEGAPIIDAYGSVSIFNRFPIPYPVPMRAIPSVSGGFTGNTSNIRSGDNSTTPSNVGTTRADVQFRASSTGRSYRVINNTDVINFDAEL